MKVAHDSIFSRASVEQFFAGQLFPPEATSSARRAYENVLNRLSKNPASSVVVVSPAPDEYLGMLLAALATGRSVYCANPHWREQEWHEAKQEIPSNAIWIGAGDLTQRKEGAFQGAASSCTDNNARILIPTGGTGGRVRFIAHNAVTLTAAAQAQCAVLGARILDSVSPLPPWHISGIMPVIRAMISGGRVQLCDGSFADTMPLPEVFPDLASSPGDEKFLLLSVVPTQLRRILARTNGIEWLRHFDCVLLGGAATSPDLLEQARHEKIRIGIGYGMTETAAFVAVYLPDDFLAGLPVSGTVLPHAHIHILDAEGKVVMEGVPGRVVITADSLAEGVGVVEGPGSRCFHTQDEGFLQNDRLYLLGRIDRHIITGGEKVDPRRVEAVLAEEPLVRAALVVGEPDAEWGTRIIALVELDDSAEIPQNWQDLLAERVRSQLARHCAPKRWIAVPRLPFNERGKLDRSLLESYLRT